MATTETKTGSLGFEDTLWKAADVLRNNMDPAEYKHVVLGLIFLKYISDAFEAQRQELTALVSDPDSDEFIADEGERADELADLLEDRDEYTAEHVFWVPKMARWAELKAKAKLNQIDLDGRKVNLGGYLDEVMLVQEHHTSSGCAPRRPTPSQQGGTLDAPTREAIFRRVVHPRLT